MSKPLLILSILILTLCKSLFAQTGKLQINLKILPELEQFLNSETIDVSLLTDGNPHREVISKTQTILFDSLKTDSIVIHISAYVKKNRFEKSYYYFSRLISIQNDSISKVELTFPEDCQFMKQSLNKHCPKCRRSDRVIPIRYGLGVPLFDSLGNIIKEERSYPGGCTVSNCDPNWYCERDKLKF